MTAETVLSRCTKTLAGVLPADRLPVLEWAWWWDLTISRWEGEGLPKGMDEAAIKSYFGLDVDHHLLFPQVAPGLPQPAGGRPWVSCEADYEALLPHLYPDPVPFDRAEWRRYGEQQERGETVVWFNLKGFFWWPRDLLGIEPHLLAFYDQPRLLHRINQDQARYLLRCIEAICAVCRPVMMNFWEDLSYNHGPMLSKAQFDEFLAPYYRAVVPELKARGILPLVDSDGQVEPLIPWFEEVGIEGMGPLERMAGVDLNRIRARYPSWRMIGGFDKTVMHLGEAAMRAEFERLLPVMRSGGYLQTVDHQTPPEVSLEVYRLYRRLQDEYAARAVH